MLIRFETKISKDQKLGMKLGFISNDFFFKKYSNTKIVLSQTYLLHSEIAEIKTWGIYDR
jgi:hypothetical protein